MLVYQRAEPTVGDDYIVCVPAQSLDSDDPPCTDNTVLYLVSMMQYLVCCLALSESKPFRKPIYTNYWFFGAVILIMAYQVFTVLAANQFNSDLFDLVNLSETIRFDLAGVILLNSICTFGFEKLLRYVKCKSKQR